MPLQTQQKPLINAYRAANLPLWVTPREAYDSVRRLHYAAFIADELALWIARRLSMCFAAGYLGHKAPVTAAEDVLRQLHKMGYSGENASELVSIIIDNADAVYLKGCSRRGVVFH